MSQRWYQTSQFARKAAVSQRTLRYYDRVGLLSPSCHSEAGHRLYSDADLPRLQQILALKFLGFSLEEIKQCLRSGPTGLRESLFLQKAMMRERRMQLDIAIQALEETEKLLTVNAQNWDAIVGVIQVIQMTQSNDWQKKYFSNEQLAQMEELSKQSYSEEQRQQLAERGKNWTEEDQRRASQQWSEVLSELKRLVAGGQDPASPAAQAFAARWLALINQFTQGDTGITKGLQNMYGKLKEMPAEQRPIPYPYTAEEEAFLGKVLEVYKQGQ